MVVDSVLMDVSGFANRESRYDTLIPTPDECEPLDSVLRTDFILIKYIYSDVMALQKKNSQLIRVMYFKIRLLDTALHFIYRLPIPCHQNL